MFSFIETKLFTRLVQEYLTDDEYSELQWFLAAAPESGPVNGALVEYASANGNLGRAAGRGKRGGYSVIYYLKRVDGVIWMLTMYPKNVIEDIPAHILRQIREEIGNG